MELIVHLQTTANEVDTGSDRAVGVVEFQSIDGQVDHFNGLPIHEGQSDAL